MDTLSDYSNRNRKKKKILRSLIQYRLYGPNSRPQHFYELHIVSIAQHRQRLVSPTWRIQPWKNICRSTGVVVRQLGEVEHLRFFIESRYWFIEQPILLYSHLYRKPYQDFRDHFRAFLNFTLFSIKQHCKLYHSTTHNDWRLYCYNIFCSKHYTIMCCTHIRIRFSIRQRNNWTS